MEKLKTKKLIYSVDGIDGYKEDIDLKLRKIFKEVLFLQGSFPEKKDRGLKLKVLREASKKISFLKQSYNREKNRYIEKILDNVRDFDYFIVIGGGEFSQEFIKELKKRNKKIKMILFLWDKVDYLPKSMNIKGYDKIFSFDKDDCKKYGYTYRESFYIDKALYNGEKKDIDIYYVGSYREKERYLKLKEIKEFVKNRKYNYSIKLFVDSKKNIDIDSEMVLEEKITYLENIEKAKKSRIIVEINFKNQRGSTLRAIESIATKSKLITDNIYLKDLDFYNPNNILIIDKVKDINKTLHENKNFFENDYEENRELNFKYSFAGFFKEILKGVE